MRCFRGFEYDADRDRSQSARRPPTAATGAALLSDPPPPAQEWPAFVTAIEVPPPRGLRSIADINESADDGFFAMPLSQDAQRASSARCYLTSSVRRRSNLAIMPRTRAVGLRTDGAEEVRGVVAERDGNIRQLDARGHPERGRDTFSDNHAARGHRSGGPAEGSGDSPAGRPARGRSQFAEPSLSAFRADASAWPPAGSSSAPVRHRRHAAFVRAGRLPGRRSDVVHDRKSQPALVWSRSGNGGAALCSPFSRGVVSLAGPDSATPPRIEFRVLEDARDPPRMLKAARFAETLLIDPGVAATTAKPTCCPR